MAYKEKKIYTLTVVWAVVLIVVYLKKFSIYECLFGELELKKWINYINQYK